MEQVVKLDPPKFPVRDQGPREGLVSSLKYYSKTRIDKNRRRALSGVGKATQQKRHPARGALKNGGSNRIEHLTSCKYPHVRADCGAKNALCGLEENRRYGYPAQKSQRQNFIG